MYISKAKKYRQLEDGSIEVYDYYRLTKKYRDSKLLCLQREKLPLSAGCALEKVSL